MTISVPLSPGSGRGLSIGRQVAWAAAAAMSGGVALVSYRYLVGAGPVPSAIAANRRIDPWLMIHVGGAATALLAGPLQFRPGLRYRWLAAHRVVGRVYVAGCLCGGAAGLVLASGTSAGPVAGLGFAMLGLAWMGATVAGIGAILRQRVQTHRRWMTRSFALAFAAVTLRIYVPASGLLGFDPLLSYRAIAWLCWVPNMIVAECLIRREPRLTLPGAPRARASRPARVQS